MTRKELEELHGSTVVFPIISEFEARYSTTCQYIDMGVRVVDRHDEAHVLTYQEIHERIGGKKRVSMEPDPMYRFTPDENMNRGNGAMTSMSNWLYSTQGSSFLTVSAVYFPPIR